MAPVAGHERWPQGDHIEFWIFGGRDRYVFALNAAGAKYDAKNLDRRWESGWELKVRKNESGWEAVAVIPMSVFGFVPERRHPLPLVLHAGNLAGPMGQSNSVSFKATRSTTATFPSSFSRRDIPQDSR